MRKTKNVKHSIGLREILPRDYVISYRHKDEKRGDTKYFFSPVNFMMARVFHTHPDELEKRVEQWQNYKKKELGLHEEGKLNYVPQFQLGDRKDLLEKWSATITMLTKKRLLVWYHLLL